MATKKEIRVEKEKLIQDIIIDLKHDIYSNEKYIFSLVYEALSERDLEDLKQIKSGE